MVILNPFTMKENGRKYIAIVAKYTAQIFSNVYLLRCVLIMIPLTEQPFNIQKSSTAFERHGIDNQNIRGDILKRRTPGSSVKDFLNTK